MEYVDNAAAIRSELALLGSMSDRADFPLVAYQVRVCRGGLTGRQITRGDMDMNTGPNPLLASNVRFARQRTSPNARFF